MRFDTQPISIKDFCRTILVSTSVFFFFINSGHSGPNIFQKLPLTFATHVWAPMPWRLCTFILILQGHDTDAPECDYTLYHGVVKAGTKHIFGAKDRCIPILPHLLHSNTLLLPLAQDSRAPAPLCNIHIEGETSQCMNIIPWTGKMKKACIDIITLGTLMFPQDKPNLENKMLATEAISKETLLKVNVITPPLTHCQCVGPLPHICSPFLLLSGKTLVKVGEKFWLFGFTFHVV